MLLCIPIIGPDLASVRHQLSQASALGQMVELRIDLFEGVSVEELVALKHQFSLPVLVTLRSMSQGGRFTGDEAARSTYLRHLCALQPELLDIELGTPRHEVLELKRLLPHTNLLISHHDTTHTPSALQDVFHQMQQLPGHYYKIATTAQSSHDALRMLKFTRDVNRVGGRLCGLCMGDTGAITRILAPVVGAPMTFASLNHASQSAPGQITAIDLRDIYFQPRHDMSTEVLGLIGNPVSSSKGHLVHNAVFAELGLPAVYVKTPVETHELAEFLLQAKAFGCRGFAVTMPLKEAIIPFLDGLDPAAKAIRAVNTIVREDRGFIGYNFDGMGALDAIERGLGRGVSGVFIVIGAGGAAKAIAYEAKRRGAQVVIVNRSYARADVLAQQLGARAKPMERLPDLLRDCPTVVAHATAVGMGADMESSLVNAADLCPETLVFDVVATPPMTRLLYDAKERGCPTVSGVEMWFGLAQQQLFHWFPHVDRGAIQTALDNARHFYG